MYYPSVLLFFVNIKMSEKDCGDGIESLPTSYHQSPKDALELYCRYSAHLYCYASMLTSDMWHSAILVCEGTRLAARVLDQLCSSGSLIQRLEVNPTLAVMEIEN